MIDSVRGTVLIVGLDHVVIDVGGVGLRVTTTPAIAAELRTGETATLTTAFVVREDSMTLYGFAARDQREIFHILQTVTGVGPRLAMTTLAVLTPESVQNAVASGDAAGLTKVPGVGKKLADRMILELRDKLGVVTTTASPAAAAVANPVSEQVSEALQGLGWNAKQADAAIARVLATASPAPTDSAGLLRASLRELGS